MPESQTSTAASLTSLAAIQWIGDLAGHKNSLHYRLYYQGADDYIYELGYNDWIDKWSDPGRVILAAPRSQIAAIVFSAKSNPQLRLYSFDKSGALLEHGYDQGWRARVTLPAPDPQLNSSVAAFRFSSSSDIRIYYQRSDNTIQEVAYLQNSGWKEAAHLKVSGEHTPVPGTALAAIQWQGLHHRVYYQAADNYIYQLSYDFNTGWSYQPRQLVLAAPGTAIAAVILDSTPLQIRLYYFDPSGSLCSYVYNGERWTSGGTFTTAPSPNSKGKIAAFSYGDHPDHQIRLYYEKVDDTIQEIFFDKSGPFKEGTNFA